MNWQLKKGYTGIVASLCMLWITLVVIMFHHKSVALFQAYARSRFHSLHMQRAIAQLHDIPIALCRANKELLRTQGSTGTPQNVVFISTIDMREYLVRCTLNPALNCVDITTEIYSQERLYARVKHQLQIDDTHNLKVTHYEWHMV